MLSSRAFSSFPTCIKEHSNPPRTASNRRQATRQLCPLVIDSSFPREGEYLHRMPQSDNETAWSTFTAVFWQRWEHRRRKKGKEMIHGSAVFRMQQRENKRLNWDPERGWGLLLEELQKSWMWCSEHPALGVPPKAELGA